MLHLDKDTRLKQLAVFGVEHTPDLTFEQAGMLIDDLSRNVHGQPKKKRFYGKGSRWNQRGENKTNITQLQADRIGLLAMFLEWDEKKIWAFIIRQCGMIKAVQMLTNKEAVKVIVGMQRVFVEEIVNAKCSMSNVESPKSEVRDMKKEFYNKVNGATNQQLLIIYKNSQTYGKNND